MNVFDHQSLAGQRYLVTGASSGIGKATAELLAFCGATVVAAGRDISRLTSVIEALAGGPHAISQCDFQEADGVAAWVKKLADVGGAFNGIFHAAGIEFVRPLRMTKQAHIEDIFRGSLFAAMGIARAASQKGTMVDGGSIVLMSSVAGASGQVGMSAYSAAKASIDGLVRSAACEFSPRKIRVNSLAAGAVRTPMHDRLMQGAVESVVQGYESSHLLGFGEPGDVAQAAVFLLGPASRWVTGTTMVVDGGYLCK